MKVFLKILKRFGLGLLGTAAIIAVLVLTCLVIQVVIVGGWWLYDHPVVFYVIAATACVYSIGWLWDTGKWRNLISNLISNPREEGNR